MNRLETITIPKQVMARQVGDEMVILDLASGTYFGLDPVGSRIWQLMSEGRTLEQVSEAILAEYDVSREVVDHDIDQLLKDLHARKLIEMAA